MRAASYAFAIVMSFAPFAGGAVAADQVPDQAPSVRQACAADFAKFCSGQTPGTDGARSCMRDHRADFSQACQSAMQERRAAMMQRIKTACAADIAKFCSAGTQADDRPGRCLRDHKDELSPTCKAAFPSRGG